MRDGTGVGGQTTRGAVLFDMATVVDDGSLIGERFRFGWTDGYIAALTDLRLLDAAVTGVVFMPELVARWTDPVGAALAAARERGA